MAKKKRKLPKRILKRPTEPIPMEEPVPELPDRRAMEGFMRGLLGGLVGSREETPLSKAQDLMDKAFESHDPMERAELAKRPSNSPPTAPMPTSCSPSKPNAARKPWNSSRRGSPLASGRWGRKRFRSTSGTSGA